AYELFLPDDPKPWPGMVILHGAGSRKENHADFARACVARGWAAVTFDQRGHGESGDAMSPAAVGDVATMARMLAGVDGVDPARICARGSSMGGWMAIHAAAAATEIAGVIAICPAGEEHLALGLRRGELEMRADTDALAGWLGEHDLRDAIERIGTRPVIILHARGDEQIPHTWSEELHERGSDPRRLIILPGGHHRSVQHDAELQGVALRWLERALAERTTDTQ
ncbi:MAG: alpha/beta hydrolase, partial [Solirubrobacterales bacterium]